MRKHMEVTCLDSTNGTLYFFWFQFSVLRLHWVHLLEQGNLHTKKNMRGTNYLIFFVAPQDKEWWWWRWWLYILFQESWWALFQGLVSTMHSDNRHNEGRKQISPYLFMFSSLSTCIYFNFFILRYFFRKHIVSIF